VTIVVLWYREKSDQLWCAADSRISSGGETVTDSGAKIFPIPVNCYKQSKPGIWKEFASFKFGFAFAGSTLSALNALALGSACTQNLRLEKGSKHLPSLESIVDLFKSVTEHYITDISSRSVGALSNPRQYYFDSFIFGFCPQEKQFKAFALVPGCNGREFGVHKVHVMVKPLTYTPIGSGADIFVELSEELDKTHPNPGVVTTLNEMLKRQSRADVGGCFQVGVADKKGFHLMPILETEGDTRGNVSFLGWDSSAFGEIDGFTVGFSAFAPKLP